MGIALLVVVVTAYFSDGIYQADEYFQINEFVSYKLGRTEPGKMTWEFHNRMRPWFQPTLYYSLARVLVGWGITDPFVLMFFFRLLTGLTGWLALTLFCISARSWFATAEEKLLFLKLSAFLCFLPYLLVRTSSETLAAAFMLLGFAFLNFFVHSNGNQSLSQAKGAWLFLSGLFLGLSFECRFQIAFSILGLVLWARWIARIKIKYLIILASGSLVSLAAGLALDAWGYGQWVLVPWNYFKINLLQGKAASFSTAPFYAYFYLIPSMLPPLGLLIMAALVLCWLRRPAHPVTWVTLPMVFAHSLIAHKEARFLFPLFAFSAAILLLAFKPKPGCLSSFADFFWMRRKSGAARFLVVLNLVFLMGLCVFPLRLSLRLQKYIYRHFPARCELYSLQNYNPLELRHNRMSFLEPREYILHRLTDYSEFKNRWQTSSTPLYLVISLPMQKKDEELFSGRVHLLYSPLPLFLTRFNYFHWVNRLDWGCLYRIDPPPPF